MTPATDKQVAYTQKLLNDYRIQLEFEGSEIADAIENSNSDKLNMSKDEARKRLDKIEAVLRNFNDLPNLAKKQTKWDASRTIDALLDDEWDEAENILRGSEGDDYMNYQLDQQKEGGEK